MGWACGTFGAGRRENLREKGDLEALGMYGKTILKFIFKKYVGGMDWMVVPHDRER